MMTSKISFEIVKTKLGKTSIKDKSGEILHNPAGPWEEAHALYVDQTDLEKKLKIKSSTPFILYDVGLGAGFNVMVALDVFFRLKQGNLLGRAFEIYSFENNFELFDFALENLNAFPQFLPFKESILEFRQKGILIKDDLKWMAAGDFLNPEISNLPSADIVFYDPFSPKVNSPMWNVGAFHRLKGLLNSESGALIATYTNSTPSRVAMLMAGLYVGHGIATASKTETTMAATHGSLLNQPLGARWFQRWERSDRHLPLSEEKFTRERVLNGLLSHPQFAEACKIKKESSE
jgi:tRNA U34 5-methylaminomethyl-2-thiouridine-forming methyltransferase MnmC